MIDDKQVNIVTIDHEASGNETAIIVPGKGRLPLVGPTSGADYERLKRAEVEKQKLNRQIVEDLHKSWQCTQCKRIWKCRFHAVHSEGCPYGHEYHGLTPECQFGKPIKNQRIVIIDAKVALNGGPPSVALVCPYVSPRGEKCRGPVIQYKEPNV